MASEPQCARHEAQRIHQPACESCYVARLSARVATLEAERDRLKLLVLAMAGLGDKAYGADPYHQVCCDMHELGARCLTELGVPAKPGPKHVGTHERGDDDA